MALSVGSVNNPTFTGVQAPNGPQKISGVISATPGSNGFLGLDQPAPALSTPTATTSNVGGGGGGGITRSLTQATPAKVYEDKTNDIGVQNAGLASTDINTANGAKGIDDARTRLGATYGAETAANETNYSNESNANLNALQGGKQSALVHGAEGRRGLLGTLSSIGALSGDSIALANQAVQTGANADLAGVNNTFSTNQTGLDSAIGTYRRENDARIKYADTAAANAKIDNTNKGLQSKQAFLRSLSDDYTAEGKSAQAKSYSDQLAALYPQIAANVPSADLTPQTAAYTPATLATYLGANNTSVGTTPAPGSSPTSLPGLVANNSRRLNVAGA